MIVGIDPGQSGGVAMLHDDGRWIAGRRMPMKSVDERKVVNVYELDVWLQQHRPLGLEGAHSATVIEAVHAMPGQGVTSMFNFGRHAGAVEAWAMLRPSAKLHRVTPRAWKKHFDLGKDKRASLDKAAKMWPVAHNWDVLANDGVAEAALIALWYVNQKSFGDI